MPRSNISSSATWSRPRPPPRLDSEAFAAMLRGEKTLEEIPEAVPGDTSDASKSTAEGPQAGDAEPFVTFETLEALEDLDSLSRRPGQPGQPTSLALPKGCDPSTDEGRRAIPGVLRDILSSDEPEFDHIWSLYHHLDPSLRDDFRLDVLNCFGRSGRWMEDWKVKELFSELDSSQWTEFTVSAAINANLALGNAPLAKEIFSKAVELHGFVQSFEVILAHALTRSEWESVLELWRTVLDKFGSELPDDITFEALRTVPDLEKVLSDFYAFADSLPETEDAQAAELRPGTSMQVVESQPCLSLQVVEPQPDASLPAAESFLDADAEATKLAVKRHFAALLARGPKGRADALMYYILRRSWETLDPSCVASLLKRAGTNLEYEDFIRLCMRRDHRRLAAQMYRQYRQIPNVRIRVFILRLMLFVFDPHDPHGMEQVLQDWYARYERLSAFGYRKFIFFYARRGDTKTAFRLWEECKRYHYFAAWGRGPVTSLMHIYAMRGDIKGARQLLASARAVLQRDDDPAEWNVLLHAHVESGDFEGAGKMFFDMLDAGLVSGYTFGTYMGMAGARGDLKLCLDLYETAKRVGVELNSAMAAAIIEAYCENDRFTEAEAFCNEATEAGIEGNYTMMWNSLLTNYANRIDLPNVNRTLERMTKLGIQYDDRTYDHLLRALTHCRQGRPAMRLVQTARDEGVFQPTLYHYLLVMSAFLRSREPNLALKVNAAISRMGYEMTTDRAGKVIEALGRWQELPQQARIGKTAENYRQTILDTFWDAMERERNSGSGDIRPVSRLCSQTIFILAHMRDFASIGSIVKYFKEYFLRGMAPLDVPLNFLSASMFVDFCQNRFDQARATWNVIWEKTKGLGKPAALREGAEFEGIPTRCYILCNPLKTMQRLYLSDRDGDGLQRLITKVKEAGFELDAKNWNYYVQGMALLEKWEEAFTTCETMLMPRWTGWRRIQQKSGMAEGKTVLSKLPLDIRRMGSSPRNKRPTSYTLLVLAREHDKMERMAPWSQDAEALFRSINETCPKVVKAIRTMEDAGMRDEEYFISLPPSSEELARELADDDSMAHESIFDLIGGDSVSSKEFTYKAEDDEDHMLEW